MTEPTKAKPKSGWYSDKASNGQVRYWDGAQWSDHRALRTVPAAPIAKRELSGGTPSGYMGAGVVMAVLAGGAFALAANMDDEEALMLMFVAALFAALSSILLSIGVIGLGVQIGLREHMYDFEGGYRD